MNIRNWFRNRELKRLRSEHPAVADYPGFAGAHKVALFFTSGKPANAEIQEFIKLFEQAGKEVHVLAYFPYSKKEQAADFRWPNYARNQVNWLGKPASDDVLDFMKHEYDIFIDMNAEKEKSFPFVRAMINAKLCIGFGVQNQAWANICLKLDPVGESQAARKEVFKYLEIINNN